jgi:F0F1-type ATP synthase delta subunit
MQARKALILSVGMMLEKVDANSFIMSLLQLASKDNSEFKFDQGLKDKVFNLAEAFNRGELNPEDFRTQLSSDLGITSLSEDEFWKGWSKIVTVGNLAEKVNVLQAAAAQYNFTVYLVSDTNIKHTEQVRTVTTAQNLIFDTTKKPAMFGTFPVYLSWIYGKNRQALIEEIVKDIRHQEVNKPNRIDVILGDASNVEDKNLQEVVSERNQQIVDWSASNNINVQRVLKGSLASVLESKYNPAAANDIEEKIQALKM